jgi:hypothetical protein
MPRPCRICCTPNWPEQIASWAAEGIVDREIARRLGINKSLVTRHRVQHLAKPARDRLAIIERGASARRERAEMAAAAASPNPSPEQQVAALFGMQRLSERLQAVEARLERSAERAESDGAHTAVAQLAGQQLREVELRGRLGGHLGPRPADGAPPTVFSLTISIPGERPLVIDAFSEVPREADEDGEAPGFGAKRT